MKYFIEMFWPNEPQDSGREFALWYHSGKISRAKNLRIGDKVLLYETGNHPDHSYYKGNKRIFASVTITGNIQKVSKAITTIVGGKKWDYMIPFEVEIIKQRDQGVTLDVLRKLLGWKKGASIRSGPIEISKKVFHSIECLLKMDFNEIDNTFIRDSRSLQVMTE